MKKFNFIFLIAFALLFFSVESSAQLWSQDFETNGLEISYTSPSVFSNNTNAHYNRTNGANISNMLSPYSKKHGTFVWAGENLNDTSIGGDGLSTKTITFSPIVIAGYTSLEFRGLFGSRNPGAGWDYTDAFYVQYKMDADPWTQLIQFASPGLSANTGLFYDADLNGIGEGSALTPTMEQYSALIPGVGNSLQFRIFVSDNSTSEEFAFDFLRLYDLSVPLVGCTYPAASNFSPTATADDGSCIYPSCTDNAALNYNPIATINNGTCVYSVANLVINEIHYNPSAFAGFADAAYEFIELYNPTSSAVSLFGWRLANAIDYTFLSTATIPAGGYILVASNAATYSGNGYNVYQYTGALNNNGSIVKLFAPGSILVDQVAYYPTPTWPLGADGNGPSLELMNPALDTSLSQNWCAGTIDNGSPGSINSCYSPILGCTDLLASNFNPNAQADDGSCIYFGCTYLNADNYNPTVNEDDGSCTFTCVCPPITCTSDLNLDGQVSTTDLLIFLAAYGTTCP